MIRGNIIINFKDGGCFDYANKYPYDKVGMQGGKITDNATPSNLLYNGISDACYYYTGYGDDTYENQDKPGEIESDYIYLCKQLNGTSTDYLLFPEADKNHGSTNTLIRHDGGSILGADKAINMIKIKIGDVENIAVSETWVRYPGIEKESGYTLPKSSPNFKDTNEYASITDDEKVLVPNTKIDGKTWTQSNITSGEIRYIEHNDSIWVACSSGSGLYYSTDSKTWIQSNITSGNLHCIDHNDSIWVAGSFNNKGLYYSTDGKTWTQSNITSGYFYYIDHNDSIWVAGSSKGLYYSTDGKTWTKSNITSGYFYYIDHNDSVFIAGSSNGLYYSTDGKTWIQSNITSDSFYYIDYNDSVFVAGSSNGLYYSTDGKTWTQSNITSGVIIYIDHNDSVFVAGSFKNGLYYCNSISGFLEKYTSEFKKNFANEQYTDENTVIKTPDITIIG